MATMAEKMAASLEELRKLQEKDRGVVLQGTAEICLLYTSLITMVRADVNVPEREDVLRLLEKIVRLENQDLSLIHIYG